MPSKFYQSFFEQPTYPTEPYSRVSLGAGQINSLVHCFQRKIVTLSTGRIVVFAIVDNALKYKYSDDNGSTWSGTWAQVVASTIYSFSIHLDNNNDILLVLDNSSSGSCRFRKLTYNSETQDWSVGSDTALFGVTGRFEPTITRRSNGDIWVVGIRHTATYFVTSAYSTNDGVSFSSRIDTSTGLPYGAILFPLGNDIGMIVQSDANLRFYKYVSSWSLISTIDTGILQDTNRNTINLLKISDTEIYVAARTSSGIKVFTFDGTNWNSGVLISNNQEDCNPNLSKISGQICIFYQKLDSDYNYNIAYRVLRSGSWLNPINLTLDDDGQSNPTIVETNETNGALAYLEFDGDNYNAYFSSIELEGLVEQEEQVNINENVEFKIESSKDEQVNISDNLELWAGATKEIQEGITVSDNIIAKVDFEKLYEQEEATISDEIIAKVDLEKEIKEETIIISDEVETSVNLEKEYINENLIISDAVVASIPLNYASAIAYGSHLYAVSNTSPVRISKINVSAGTPSFESYELIGFNKARAIKINSTTGFIYVIGQNQLAKININDLEDVEIIDLQEENDLETLETYNTQNLLYVGTDNEDGELIILDERVSNLINTDFRLNLTYREVLKAKCYFINGKKINCDFRLIVEQKSIINCDFRLIVKTYEDLDPVQNIKPIEQTDFRVYIDNNEITDVDLDSITIAYDIESNETQASFTLARYHDKPNYTLENVYSPITGSRKVEITVKNNCIFDGLINSLNLKGSDEHIEVTALANAATASSQTSMHNMVDMWRRLRYIYIYKIDNPELAIKYSGLNKINIPLSKSGTQRHLYDIIVDDINNNKKIENPLDSNATSFNGVMLNLGVTEQEYWEFTNSYASHCGGILRVDWQEVFFGLSQEEKTAIEQLNLTTWLNTGLWQGQPGFTYFWWCSAEKYIVDYENFVETFLSFNNKYIGTSLSPISSGGWFVNYAYADGQKLVEIKKTPAYTDGAILFSKRKGEKVKLYNYYPEDGELLEDEFGGMWGRFYKKGLPPYKIISSPKTGAYIPQFHWKETEDGIYSGINNLYNFIPYCKQLIDIEYLKLLDINGSTGIETDADIRITIDALLYYNIRLLSRINITNTIEENVYNNNNGFPLSVKNIIIDLSTMNVQLLLDNKKSTIELDVLDNKMPDLSDYGVSWAFSTGNWGLYLVDEDRQLPAPGTFEIFEN